jgi:hypothetical protein
MSNRFLGGEALNDSGCGLLYHFISRLLKNAHLLRFPHPSSLRRTFKYASLLGISGALHLGIFEQPGGDHFFSNLLVKGGQEDRNRVLVFAKRKPRKGGRI